MADHERDEEKHARVPNAASQQTGKQTVEHAATEHIRGTGVLLNPNLPAQPADPPPGSLQKQSQVPPDGTVAAGGSGDVLPFLQRTKEPEEQDGNFPNNNNGSILSDDAHAQHEDNET